ncbi:MAG TPA: exodeoxyribonuclease VII large subunit, partial [Anaerolineales bacterium]|nr:exodeoxyribonuclease VII large subunit [Anaerolineales bacterium]
MSLFPPDAPPTWSVTDLTRYMREMMESDHNLRDIWISGEISNVSTPKSGHLYFTLKDANASLKCVMWKPQVMRLRFLPREGDAIEVHGAISVYEQAGQYQLYADVIRQTGEGVLYQEFMRLKARLEMEGLFDESRKRPLPAWPRRIGLITSPTGAALQDMLNTLRRRFPLVEVILAPTAVQGVEAPPGIVRCLRTLNQWTPAPDLIIVARGGGSIEDLWCFNDETVVRAVAASAIPVISGVGHETDFTLTDFAADLRAPTPTAAAELATPN